MPTLTRRGFLGAAGLAAASLAAACSRQPATRVSDQAWIDLRAGLRGSLLRPGDAGYAELATPANLRFAATTPDAVAVCTGTDDIAAALQWARKVRMPFAIRGGGQNYAAASSSRGLVISTHRMNAVRIDGTTLFTEAGMLDGGLAKQLAQGGKGRLLLPGGNYAKVGLAGLTLGGGIGPNSAWAGLTADRLRKATVVTADGTVVTASDTDNPDLFWGLRGGAGANFGVLADLQYELAEVPARATTARITIPGRDAVVAAVAGFQKMRAEAARTATGHLTVRRTRDDVEATLTAQILGTEAAARDLLAAVLKIPGANADIAERTFWDAHSWNTKAPVTPVAFWNRSLYAEDFLPEDAVGQALDVIARFPDPDGANRGGSMSLNGWVGGAVGDVEPGATAYVHRRAKILVEISSWWPSPEQSQHPASPIPPEIRSWVEELWGVLLPESTGGSYQNFSDPELPEWRSAYYGDNLVRLQNLKATWDPENVFTFPQGLAPAR